MKNYASYIGQRKDRTTKNSILKEKALNETEFKVVFVRHGQSLWNKQGKFSGWIDVPLNETGESEAIKAGQDLKDAGYHFDIAHTSMLSRAHKTCSLIIRQMGIQDTIHVNRSWRINERHYGML